MTAFCSVAVRVVGLSMPSYRPCGCPARVERDGVPYGDDNNARIIALLLAQLLGDEREEGM